MPNNSKIAPTPLEQDKLLSILYQHGVSRKEIEYAIPDLPTLLSSSNTLPNGKIVRLEYAIPGRNCITPGQIVSKTIIKANNGCLYDTFNMRGVIGSGGYGVVFVAQDLQTQTFYPLKRCENEDTTQEQLTLFELGIGKAWAQVAEPCGLFYKLDGKFSSVHGYNQKTYIVMKYLGDCLRDTLERYQCSPLGPKFINDSFTIAIEMAVCLTRMHEVYGLSHLDLKPGNMFYRPYLPRGEKVEFGDYASTVAVHKLVKGSRGTPPYTVFDDEYVNTNIVAEQRDLRTFFRCLTGVNADNYCAKNSNAFKSGVFSTAVLHRYDLYYFLFFDPKTVAVDFELPKASIIAAKLIAAHLGVSANAQVRILGRPGLAVQIIANYISDPNSPAFEKKKLIENWACNPDENTEEKYLLLLKLNLLEKADMAIQDQDLMHLLCDPELSYAHKAALALLYKRGLLDERSKQQLDSLSNDALKMLKKAYVMKNWELFSILLDSDPSLINIKALDEQYFHVVNTQIKPYFDDKNTTSYGEHDGMEDVLEWSKITLFESSGDFSKLEHNVKHAFRWGVWQHTLLVNPSFTAVIQWLRNFDSSEVLTKITRAFYSQLTDINLAKVILHLKENYVLHQLTVLFDFEDYIADYLYSRNMTLEDISLDNFANIIIYSDYLRSSYRNHTAGIIGYLLATRRPSEYLMSLPQEFLYELIATEHRVTNLEVCLRRRSFVEACYKIYKTADLYTDDVYYLSREIERNDYSACEFIALQNTDNSGGREIFVALRTLRLRYHIVDSFESYVQYFDKYASLRLALVHILDVVNNNNIYRTIDKDLFNVRKAILIIYKDLDKLAVVINFAALERELLRMLQGLAKVENNTDQNFEIFIRGFVDTINDYVTNEQRMGRLVEYDRQQSSSSFSGSVSNLFNGRKLASIARNINNTTYILENCICELPLSQYQRADYTA